MWSHEDRWDQKNELKDWALGHSNRGHSNINRGQEKRRISKETDKNPPVVQEENQETLMP